MLVTFDIHDWNAWFPDQPDAQPDMAMIPAMLRRRLSPMARAAMSVIMPLAEAHGAMPLVYVSRHGDLNRTLGLLQDLACGEPLSPTAFSLSVHNATAGLFSIQQGLTNAITAISGGAEEVLPALLESLGLCTDVEPKVLCIFCDEPPPAIYASHCGQPQAPYALALVVSRGQGWSLAPGSPSLAPLADTPQAWQLFECLQQGAPALALPNNGNHWQLQRCQP